MGGAAMSGVRPGTPLGRAQVLTLHALNRLGADRQPVPTVQLKGYLRSINLHFTLGSLTKRGLVERIREPDPAVRFSWKLTKAGKSTIDVLEARQVDITTLKEPANA